MVKEGTHQVEGLCVVAVAQTKLPLLIAASTIHTTKPLKYTKPKSTAGCNQFWGQLHMSEKVI